MRSLIHRGAVAEVSAGAAAVRRARRRSSNLAGYLFISPWLIGFFGFTLIPIVASLYLSFTNYDIFTPPRWIGLDNYRTMFFEDPRYWKSVGATFYYVFTAVPLRLVFALAIAMLLNAGFSFLGLYRAIFYIPSIIGGSVAVALMWRRLFGVDGLINTVLGLGGLQGPNWLGDPRTAIWTLILLAVWQFGSPMLIFLAGLKQIPQELYEAAAIDGAGPWKKFLRITLPLLSPVIFFNLVMQIIAGFMVFTQAFVITRGGPLDSTRFYSLYLYDQGFQFLHMGYAAAMAWVLLIIIAFFTALVFKSSSFWVYYEADAREEK
ncbi:carbohydrate ABC transporter permease [Kallotenue papyrolyticum]|uniref:carbohydrate ABC transporter permease n=1 Tax=Kallotenue papyrolyticum TaxID=1325125 RepID=UPI0004786518|nr:sugar ABC transporter permease [Kallotenue papyrolyticum]